MPIRISKKKQYLKQNHSITVKVSKIYITLCMSNNGDVHTIESVPLSFWWQAIQAIYLQRKVVCFVLFCSYKIHRIGVLQMMFLMSLESSQQGGCMGLVPWRLDLRCKSSWILNDFSLKIKLNRSWKFRRNWNVPLVLLKRSWWAGFNGIYLVRFGFRMWEILVLKWFLLLKIQINPKNQKGKISWGRRNTWANSTGHTSYDECCFCYWSSPKGSTKI